MIQDWIKMNKLVIPTILAFSVLIAGAFAFVPVDKATTVDEEIIAALNGTIVNSEDAILLALEDKIKLSSNSTGPTNPAPSDNARVDVTIRALDDGQTTTFNLKECYLRGDPGGFNKDVKVIEIFIDGIELYQAANRAFTPFGPIVDITNFFTLNQVELLSGLGFHTGLGADDTIILRIGLDDQDSVDEIKCIAFVQNSADLDVTIDLNPTLPP